MKQVTVLLVALCSCGKQAPKPTPGAGLTFKGTVRNVLSPSSLTSPPAPVSVTTFNDPANPLCSGPPSVQIQIYDLQTLLAGDFTSVLASCLSEPATGQYSCHGDTLGSVQEFPIAVLNNAPGAPNCIAPTLIVAAVCSPNCAAGSIAHNGVLNEGDSGVTPLEVFPYQTIVAMDEQLAATSTFSTFGSLLDSGAVATVLVDPNGQLATGIKPWMPVSCLDAPNACTSWILAPDPVNLATIDLTATATSSIGIFLTQAQTTPAGGGPPVAIALNIDGNDANGFGGIDCSSGTPSQTCYTPAPNTPTRKGTPLAASAFISINYVVASAASGGVCPLQSALTSDQASLYTCP